jgi:hypothetical protein
VDSEAQALVSSTAALTTTRDLAHVTGPENLPPSVAREIAEVVATYRVTPADFVRHDLLKLGATTGAVLLLALVFLGAPSAVGALIGFGMAVPLTWRKAPLARAQQHLKELGIGWRARRRVGTKLAAIVGASPAPDPAQRPAVDEIVALLAPGGEDPWAPMQKAEPRALLTASELDVTVARSVVAHALDYRRRERGLVVVLGLLALGSAGFAVVKGSALFGALMVVSLAVSGSVGLGFGRLMQRPVLKRMLTSLGLAPAEQQRIVSALKQVLASKADIPRQEQPEVLAQRLISEVANRS